MTRMTTPAQPPSGRSRTAEEIAATEAGPRPLPGMTRDRARRLPTSARAETSAGLEILAVRRASSPMMELRLRIPFGDATARSAHQAATHAARAEVLAETILLGTAENDRQQLDSRLAAVGGHLTAQVNPQRLLISGAVLATGVDDVLDILAETLTAAAYRSRDVGRERDKLVEHLTIAASQPAVAARQQLQRRRFGTHPAVVEMPEPADVAEVSAAAVRGIHQRCVLPQGSTLVLVGDLRPATAVDHAATRLAPWQGRRPAQSLSTPPEIVPGTLRAFHRPGAVQVQTRLSLPGVLRTDPDYAAAQLANLVFGGYFSSRLVENLREDKGWTYHASSALESWPGRAAIVVGYDTATEVAAAALVEARYELGRLATTPPAESEIEAARNYAVGSLAWSLSNQAGYASMLASLAGSGLDQTWLRDHRSRLLSVTAEQVATAAQRLFSPASVTGVLVGDLDTAGDALARLSDVELDRSS